MTRYYELRTISNKPNASLGAEIARHLAVRQDLGTAVIVTNSPFTLISVVRKNWLHLARQLQKKRACTLNPEEILRLTHTIMHMHRMRFVTKSPTVSSEAQIFFVTPKALDSLPVSCFTVYLCDLVNEDLLLKIIGAMPASATVVNFDVGIAMNPLGLRPKSDLEAQVIKEWASMAVLLNNRGIDPTTLVQSNSSQPQKADDALDTLLTHGHEFLMAASNLRYAIHLAQPITTISAEKQQMFDAIMRLAHRVQALSPKGFDNYLVRTFGDKNRDYFESYFLRDIASESTPTGQRNQCPILAPVFRSSVVLAPDYFGAESYNPPER